MKKIFLFIFLSYFVFFFLLQPEQTPDEPGHYEVIYWLSRGIYPKVVPDLPDKPRNPHPYGSDLMQLFHLGNEDPNIIVNFEKIQKSPLQYHVRYPHEDTFISETSQAYNPPLYYFFGKQFFSLATSLGVNLIGQFYMTRLTSTIFYFAMVYVFYRCLQLYFTDKKMISGLLLFFSLNPIFVQSGIGISPDIAVAFFSLLLFMFILKRSSNVLLLGIICGLALLSKISALFMIPVSIIYLFLQHTSMKKIIFFSLVILCTQIPWFSLNLIRYQRLTVESIALGTESTPVYSVPGAIFHTLIDFRHTFMHFSGFLGQGNVFPFPPVFLLYTAGFLLFLGLGIYHSIRSGTQKHTVILLYLVFMFLFFFTLSFARKFYSNPGWGIGARNILPVYPQLILCIGLGIESILKKRSGAILTYFSVFYYNFILVFVLIPRYYV